MSAFDCLQKAWRPVESTFMSSRPIARLARQQIGVAHYAAYLRETYFYTRENPQIQAIATAWFRGRDREMVKPFLRHALSEVGHDRMALDDMEAIGWDVSYIPGERPLPSTAALISFPYYAIQYRSPISYLGYLFFLEFLPTSRGGDLAAALAAVGVPPSAMSFLAEHRSIDVHHNLLMQQYADTMLRTTPDIDEVVYSMEVTGELYAHMVEGAFDKTDRNAALTPEPVAA